MRQQILFHQLNDDDWYTLTSDFQVISQSSRKPVSIAPYPNFMVRSGLQIKCLRLEVWREASEPPPHNIGRDTYAGHLGDGSSVQKHSAGPLYPYVIFAQETIEGLRYGVVGPKKPNGILVGTYDQAVYFAISLKGN
jgi:hypothetical protein